MYTRIKIENFRGLKSVEIDGLKRINILVGKNNCGKTSVLEAMWLLAEAGNPYVPGYIAEYRRQPAGKHLSDTWRTMFGGSGAEGEWLQITGGCGPHSRDVSYRIDASEKSRYPSAGFKLGSAHFDLKVTNGTEGDRHVRASISPSGEVETDVPVRGDFISNFLVSKNPLPDAGEAELFSRLKRTKRDESVVNALKLVDDRLRGLEFISESAIVADFGLARRIPLQVAGEGTNRLFNLVVALLNCPKGLLLVDEIDDGLHHSVMESLWSHLASLAKEHDVQIVATTHSDEMMRRGLERLREAGEAPGLFRLDRLDDGSHRVSSFSEGAQEAVLEMNLEVRA